jgi:hypothetical protein
MIYLFVYMLIQQPKEKLKIILTWNKTYTCLQTKKKQKNKS